MRILTVLALLITCAIPQTTLAQDASFVRALDTINRVNRIRPEQSPRFERSKEIFSDRMIDSTNRVVGEVNDVIVDPNGAINMLDVEFNRLRLGTDKLAINYRELGIRPVSNGYKMNYTDDQITDLVPSLLAGVETASGEDANTFSVRKTIGRKIENTDGQILGTVDDVLFDNLGGRAELLLVAMSYKSLRGKYVAIPFAEANYRERNITVSNEFGQAMLEYAKDR